MVRSLPYWVVFVVPLIALAGLRAGGLATLATLAFVFGVIPMRGSRGEPAVRAP